MSTSCFGRCTMLSKWHLLQKKKILGIFMLLIYILLVIQYDILTSFIANALFHTTTTRRKEETPAQAISSTTQIEGVKVVPPTKIDFIKEMQELEKTAEKLEDSLKKEHNLWESATETNEELQRLKKYMNWGNKYLSQAGKGPS